MKSSLIVGCAVAAALAAGGAELPLVTNGVPCVANIVLPQDASRAEQKAGMELRRWMGKAGCGSPAVRNEPKYGPNLTTIIVTSLPHGGQVVPAVVRERLEKSESDDAFAIFAQESGLTGPSILIVGKRGIGAYYGANCFLEDYVGVRFFHPGPNGTYIPKKRAELSVPTGKVDFREPWVWGRRLNTWYGSVKPLDMEKAVLPWQARRGYQYGTHGGREELNDEALTLIALGNSPCGGGGELVLGQAIPLSMFDAHPEYFALVNGRRERGDDRSMRRCLSNPEVKRLVVEYASRHLAMSPAYSLDYRDYPGGWCECEKCRAYGSDASGHYSVPNLAHRFEKECFDELIRRFPEARFGNLIYLDYRTPITIDLQYDERVTALYCPHQRCYAHPLTAPCNAKFRKQYDFWNSRCGRIGTFDYYCYSNVPYCPVEYTLAEDIRYYAKSHYRGWLEDASCGPGGKWPYLVVNWQMYYLASKMFWNRNLDEKALLDEAYGLYYGSAATVMKKYHARRLELWNACPAHSAMSNFSRPSYCLQPDGSKEELLAYLSEADKAAKGDREILARIAIDRDSLTDLWIAKNKALRDALSKQQPLDVRRRTGAIAIDGVLDDAGWQDAFATDDFKRETTDATGKKRLLVAAGAKTRVRCTYDDDAWYVAYEAMTDHTNTPLVVKTPADVRDADLWLEDAVELFVMPPYDGYFHLIVNPNGALYDSEGQSGQEFDSKAEIKTKILADRFTVEMRIPVAPMRREKIAPGDKWLLHFVRDDKRLAFPDGKGRKQLGEMSSIDGVAPHVSTGFRRVDVK